MTSEPDGATGAGASFLYVSWGGSGRSASLRAAFRRVAEADGGLIHLAVLDSTSFSDLDQELAEVVADELEWLLDAQTNLIRTQLNLHDLPVRIAVRRGEVLDEIAGEVASMGDATILLGAPVPTVGDESLDQFLASLAARTGQKVEVVLPDD